MILRIGLICTFTVFGVANSTADSVSDGQWFRAFLSMTEANLTSKGTGITVAVVDTGVDRSHNDLRGCILAGADLLAGEAAASDADGHGTGMAGLVCSHGRVNGIAPGTKVLPVRVSRSGSGAADTLAQGIRWAAQQGAQVISLSASVQTDDLLLRQTVEDAMAHNVVVVAAAGNRPEDVGVQWPAAIPGVIAVAGVDRNGNHSKISVSGPEVVLAAPSDDISSTNTGGGYRVGTGTSDATAIVAGVVALVRSRFPQLKAAEVVRRLTATAIDKGPPGRDPDYGYGIVNPVGALTAELPAEMQAASATSTPTTAQEKRDRFSWWLIALPAAVAVVAITFGIWRWRRTTRSRTGTPST